MNEKQLTDTMSLAVLDEPPLGFDPDEVVDGIIRHRRRTRLAAASGAAAVVVAATAVAFGGMGPPGGVQPAGPSPSNTPSPVPQDPAVNPEPCPVSMPEVVPPLLAKHFPNVEFNPVPETLTDPANQYWLNLLADDQQFVDVTCRPGIEESVSYEPPPEIVIDEDRPGGAHLQVVRLGSGENQPSPIFSTWTRGDELLINVKVYGGDELVTTPETVAALTEELAAMAR